MYYPLIDCHIHLDQYALANQRKLLSTLDQYLVDALVAVSTNASSAYEVLKLAKLDSRVLPAIGFHPEQALPRDEEVEELFSIVEENKNEIVAVGEIGVPYYLRQEHPNFVLTPYVELLERFIRKAVELELPVALHAIYEDASIVLDLLERLHVKKAHFHWFKGDELTVGRLVANGYMVSVPPEVVYRQKLQQIVRQVPLSQLMVETDGPWSFGERFAGKTTHPWMMHDSVHAIAALKRSNLAETYGTIYETTEKFYKK